MRGFSREEIINVIDDVISGDRPLLEWDYLVSVCHADEFTKKWSLRLKAVETQYHVSGSGELISDEGIEKLKELRDELERELSKS